MGGSGLQHLSGHKTPSLPYSPGCQGNSRGDSHLWVLTVIHSQPPAWQVLPGVGAMRKGWLIPPLLLGRGRATGTEARRRRFPSVRALGKCWLLKWALGPTFSDLLKAKGGWRVSQLQPTTAPQAPFGSLLIVWDFLRVSSFFFPFFFSSDIHV